MVKNEIVEVSIEDIGNDGEGIGRSEGYTLFVKGAVVGDRIRARILKMKKTYGYAKIEEMLEPSADRVAPVCPVAGRCGGCQLQQLSYEKQLEYKTRKVKNCLQRIGGISEERLPAVMEPIIGMEEPYHYRNKAQYPVGLGQDGRPTIGFYAGHSHTIIPQLSCALQDPVNEVILRVISGFLTKHRVPPYREEQQDGVVRHILTRVGAATGQVMVCFVLNASPKELSWWTTGKEMRQLVQCLQEEVAAYQGGSGRSYVLQSVCLNLNTEHTNVILGKKIIPVYGETFLTDRIGEISYRISPLSFYQVNPQQTERLYRKALEYAQLSGQETVWDLYCGIGTISLFLARAAKQVYGVEIIPQAVEDARQNASCNGITDAVFFAGAAEEVMPQKYAESEGRMRADVVCLDPPRKGCETGLLDTVIRMEPTRIVYVSCDPATLARDVHYLEARGYRLERVCPVDQFGQTGHVETVVLLSHKKPDGHINVKVEFGEGEGKVPLDNIAKRASDLQNDKGIYRS